MNARRTAAMIKSGKVPDVSMRKCQNNYKKALEKGVLKILSKMGISLLSCYHGAQIFEIYGLGKEAVDFAFKGSVSRIGGMSISDLQKEAESFWIKVLPLSGHFSTSLELRRECAIKGSVRRFGGLFSQRPAEGSRCLLE